MEKRENRCGAEAATRVTGNRRLFFGRNRSELSTQLIGEAEQIARQLRLVG
jgi:hypothetical protein